ncbi:MAG: SLBB domain-containing protein, partial [Burkholderiales bacterium]|nr:SLBB domain-containing protein [Burkholderiales bacterium]
AAQAPGFDRTRLLNQIAPSTNEVNWEYAVIERINPETLATDLLPFNLARAVIEADPQHNLALRPGDVLTVFSREDIALPQAKQTKFIRVEGEVPAPGIYQIRPGETLRQLLVRIGGATREAFLFGAEFTRESTRVQQQKALDESINRLEQDIQRQATTRAQNVMTTEDSASLKEQADAQRRLVLRLRELRSSGRIVLQMPEQPAIADLPEIVLEDGDRFYVPPRPSMVSVFGSVFSGNSFVYRPDARVADYLGYAGGATRSADESSTYVLRADGSVLSARQGGGFLRASISGARLIPGDAIIVPEEIDRTTFTKNLRDWTQIFFQFGLGAAALKVIRD